MALKASSEVSRLEFINFNKLTKCAKKIINVKSNVNSNWVLSIENGYIYVPLRFKLNFEYAKNTRYIKLYGATQAMYQVFVCSGTPKIVKEEKNTIRIPSSVCLLHEYADTMLCICWLEFRCFIVAPWKWKIYWREKLIICETAKFSCVEKTTWKWLFLLCLKRRISEHSWRKLMRRMGEE